MEVEYQEYGGEHRWTACDRAVVARMEHYLDRSESLKVEVEELEYCLLGPEESEVGIRHIAMNARSRKLRRLFHVFGVQGQGGLLVVIAVRWDENSRKRARQEERVPRAQQGHQIPGVSLVRTFSSA